MPQKEYHPKSNAKFYYLTLRSGLDIKLKAHAIARTDSLYLFLYRQCFVDIPVSAVENLTSSTPPLLENDLINHTDSYCSNSSEAQFSIQLSENHFCLIIASDFEYETEHLHFLCNQSRFLTFFDAASHKLEIVE